MIRPINPPGSDQNIIVTPATETAPGIMEPGDKIKVNYVTYSDKTLSIQDIPFGGFIGSPTTTVDVKKFISINQTTSNQILMIPNPSLVNEIRYIIISNVGTVSFYCLNTVFIPNTISICLWNTIEWTVASSNLNPTGSFNSFNHTGDFTVPEWNSLSNITTSALVNLVSIPTCNTSNYGKHIVITKVNNTGSISLLCSQNILPYNTSLVNGFLKTQYESITLISTSNGPVVSSGYFRDQDFTGSSSIADGERGWVPKPLTGQQNMFLRGDGVWYPAILKKEYINVNTALQSDVEYYVDSSSSPLTLSLPLIGNHVRLIDSNNTWSSNNVTVDSTVLSGQRVVNFFFSNNIWINDLLSLSSLGLGNVDNTSDLNKPISIATQTALNNKFDKAPNTSHLIFNTDSTITDVDLFEHFSISTSLANLNLSLGNPLTNKIVLVSNAGLNSFNINLLNLPPSTMEMFLFSQGVWNKIPSSSGGGVSSVFGRIGDVLSANGDYNISQITNGLSNQLSLGKLYVGNVSNVATAVTLTGDVSIDGTGVSSIKTNVNLLGSPTTTTQASTTNNTTIATTAFVQTIRNNVSLALSNQTASGVLPVTVENYDLVSIDQTTGGSTFTLPTSTIENKSIKIANNGTTSFSMYGVTIEPSTITEFVYQGTTWVPVLTSSSSGGFSSLTFPNQSVNGVLGTTAEANANNKFDVSQTTDNISLTLPPATENKVLMVENIGTESFNMYANLVNPGYYITLQYNNNTWNLSSCLLAYIHVNANSDLIANRSYSVDTNNGSFNLNLSDTSFNGAEIVLYDTFKTWGINKFNILGYIDGMSNIQINSGGRVVVKYDVNSSQWISDNESKIVPNMTMSNYSRSGLNNYISDLSVKNKDGSFYVNSYTNTTTAVEFAYAGGVYSPKQNRIYLVPSTQAAEANWHYIDCNTGAIVAYPNTYVGTTFSYEGGVYSPKQNRIYFVPFEQSNKPNWHYIDCNTGNIVAYTNTSNAIITAYKGGVYSPTRNRIYFIPSSQSIEADWHYIDCNDGTIKPYTNPYPNAVDDYMGGVYSPTQNRIYMVPYSGGNALNWYYIDCNSGNVIAYSNTSDTISRGYTGGVYSPIQNRIYLVPDKQGNQANWHYIDCNTGAIVAYPNTDIQTYGSYYYGGVYSPLQNRVYICPASKSNKPEWHYIQELTSDNVSVELMSGPLFNKF